MRYFFILCGIFMLAVSFLISGRVAKQVRTGYAHNRWTEIHADIEKILYSKSVHGDWYCELDVFYRFRVKGREYRGNDRAVTYKLMVRNAPVFIKRNLNGRVTVFYNPENPAENLIEKISFLRTNSILAGYVIMLLSGIALIISGVIFIIKGY